MMRLLKWIIVCLGSLIPGLLTYAAFATGNATLILLTLPGFLVGRMLTGAHGGTSAQEFLATWVGVMTNMLIMAAILVILLFTIPAYLKRERTRQIGVGREKKLPDTYK